MFSCNIEAHNNLGRENISLYKILSKFIPLYWINDLVVKMILKLSNYDNYGVENVEMI